MVQSKSDSSAQYKRKLFTLVKAQVRDRNGCCDMKYMTVNNEIFLLLQLLVKALHLTMAHLFLSVEKSFKTPKHSGRFKPSATKSDVFFTHCVNGP